MQPVHWTLYAVCLEPPLFQFHEEQDEDRPHPHGYRELNQLCVAQGISSWNQKRKPQHSQSREYPEDQFGFGVHHSGFISLVLRLASSSQNQEGATPRCSYGRSARPQWRPRGCPLDSRSAGPSGCSPVGSLAYLWRNIAFTPTTLSLLLTACLLATGGIGGTIERRQGGCEMTVRLLVEIVIVVIVLYVAVRFFRKRG